MAMAREEPIRDLIDDVEAFAAQAGEPGEDLVDEASEVAREVTPNVALEIAPLALLFAQLWAVLGEPDQVQPPLPLGQRVLADLAPVTGSIVQSQEDRAPGSLVAPSQGVQVELEPGRSSQEFRRYCLAPAKRGYRKI
jgi:hypothetical protein